MHALVGAALVQRPGGGHVAAAVGDHHHRQGGEGLARALVAMQARQVRSGLAEEARKAVGLPEAPGARVAGIDGELRRNQHGVDVGLARSGRRPSGGRRRRAPASPRWPCRNTTMSPGRRASKPFGMNTQRAAIAEAHVLPQHAARCAVAAPAVLVRDIEKRPAAAERAPRRGTGARSNSTELGSWPT